MTQRRAILDASQETPCCVARRRRRSPCHSSLVAMKTVLGARIDVNLDIGPLGLDVSTSLKVSGVLFAEIQLLRHLRRLVGRAHDGAAAIAYRCRQAGKSRRRDEGDAAA